MKTNKFNIGDIVFMEDTFSFNPADGAYSVGKIEAIHFKTKSGIFGDAPKEIVYTVSGFRLRPREEDLKLWNPLLKIN